MIPSYFSQNYVSKVITGLLFMIIVFENDLFINFYTETKQLLCKKNCDIM